MAEPVVIDKKHTLQVATLVVGFCVVLNVGFFLLSYLYFNDKRGTSAMMLASITDAHITNTRIAFAIFSAIVGVMSILVSISPRWIAHGIAALAGLAALIASVAAFNKGITVVFPTTLAVLGVLFPVLVWKSVHERSRAAWSFLLALCAVLGLVLVLGSTKIRGALDIGLWTALIIPGLLTVATFGLAMLRADYRDRA